MSSKITDLTAQAAGTLHDNDLFVDVDVSDTTMAPSGTDKKITWGALKALVIGQVVQATKTDTATVTGTAFGSVFTATITPTATTSKVRVRAMLSLGAAASQFVFVRLTRGGSTLIQGDAASNRTRVTTACNPGAAGALVNVVIEYVDSPASVAALTYEIEIASHSTGAVYLNRTGTDTDAAGFSRGSSVITLEEILA